MNTEVVFLFGAGASKGAAVGGHVLPEEPPLMSEVYNRLAVRFPAEWGTSSKRGVHADRYRANFEQTFTEIDLGLAPDMPPGTPGTDGLTLLEQQRPLALYFASLTLDGSGEDLYTKLILHMKEAGVLDSTLFASLNYDCLFEEAAMRLGLRVDYLLDQARAALNPFLQNAPSLDPVPGETIQVAKLHGSSNFVTEIDPHYRAIIASPNTQLEVRITPVEPRDLARTLQQRFTPTRSHGTFPVMTQISTKKQDVVAPSQIHQVRGMWEQAVASAARIVVIGVAPREEDTHVWEALQGARGDIAYVGGEEYLAEWQCCNERFRSLGSTFEEAYGRLLSYLRD